jgi:hypothetical protein
MRPSDKPSGGLETGEQMVSKQDLPSTALESIPGIGPSLAEDLRSLGIDCPARLKGRSPERLYRALCARSGTDQDRCVLYAFRCAVYYASNSRHDPELLKWWNWTDERKPGSR